jgi:DNA helicase-4
LGFKGGSIEVSEKGVTLHKSDRSYFIDNHSFVKKSRVEKNIIFCSLVFNTSKGEVRFGKLTEAKANEVFEWLQAHWYLEIFPEVNKIFKRVSRKLNQSYVRSSEWPKIERDAKNALKRFIQVPVQGLIEKSKRNPFVGIQLYATMGLGGLEDYRKAYVDKNKSKFAEYFANIESNPLTDNQIDACIIDEDNNLVLAGAGTGKTSAMVGRAGFLLESKQAKNNDILMLAFGKKAAKEMQERMHDRIGINDISISTFHKLGKDIISKVENGSPSISKYAEDNTSKKSVFKRDVSAWVDDFLKEESYKNKVLEYFEDYLFVEKSPFEFESQGEYFSHIEADEIRTFKGEKVKGYGERIIANFLLRMGIEYEYEAKYKYLTKTIDFRQYQPDFYLPEHDVYIEHVGIDRDGSTAPYIDREAYEEGMEWKRKIHKANETTLVETFYYEHKEGQIRSLLKQRLTDLGVECNPMPDDAIIETLREHNEITKFSDLMADILKRYKANWFDKKQLDEKIKDSPYPKHLNIALELLKPIRNRYEKALVDNDEIDFDDMIGKALEYVQDGKFKATWKYIMVDEFQDISDPRARLVQALKTQKDNCSLFCVGDDWQAIYRFTGSDISFTTGFSNYFGTTKTTKLNKTFRFNNSIADVSTKFVLKNPLQTNKEITTLDKVTGPAISLLREISKVSPGDNVELKRLLSQVSSPDDDFSSSVLGRYIQVNKVLEAISKLNKKASVLILGRYNFTLPKPREMKLHAATFPNLELLTNTVHISKGKEADYVVVLDLQSGKNGFPSEKTTNPLLEALLPSAEGFMFAEERRLLYVAMTRARYRTYLVVDMATASSFVNELINDDYDIEMNEFEISNSQKISQQLHCIECETGIMQKRVRRKDSKTFYGCSHWSLCKHTEDACDRCGDPMIRVGEVQDYRVCHSCRNWILVCPECKGDMVCLNGRYGLFWRNKYSHSQDKTMCQFKISNNKVTPPQGFGKIEDILNETNIIKQPQKQQPVQTQDSMSFSSYKEAGEYAKKLAVEKQKTVNLVEGNGCWIVKVK